MATITVGTGGGFDHETIQAAIDAASPGDTILVSDGTYDENLLINKSITLISENGREHTTIVGSNASGLLGTIQITPGVNDVRLGDIGKGFTIVGIDGTPGLEKAAVYLQGAHDGLIVQGNDIVANGDAGMMSEFNQAITNALIDSNIFSGQTFNDPNPAGNGFGDQFTLPNVPRQLVVLGSNNGPSNNITFTNNEITGTAGGLNDLNQPQGNTLVTIDAANSLIADNDFTGFTNRFATQLRARDGGTNIQNNTFSNDQGGNLGVYIENDGNPGIYSNSFVGTAGDDTIFASAGNNTVDGGGGNDTYDMTAAGAGGALVDLETGIASSAATGIDTLTSIENVRGSAGGDILSGDAGDNVFFATAGTDIINGKGGSDTFNAASAVSSVNINLSTGAVTGAFTASLTSIENAVGGSGNDTLVGSSADNNIDGGAGTDTVVFTGSVAATDITFLGGAFVVQAAGQGTDTLTNVEIIDPDGAGGARILLVGGGGFATIQEAVTAANAGDTIMVAPGTYAGNIIINKSLTLLSTDGSGTTVIEGSSTGGGLGTIMITPGVNNVTIGDAGQGFHIVGYDVATHSIEHAAIYLQGAHSNITIRGNNVEANGEAGLLSEYNAALSNIVVDQNEFSGITFFDPPNVRVDANTENAPRPLVFLGTNNGTEGIANNIQFTDNLVTGTAGGFTSGGAQAGNVLVNIDATDAVITGNTFTGFTHQGMPQLRAREENPTIENNDFSNANGGTTGLLVLDDGVPGTVANNAVSGAIIVTTPSGTEMGFSSIQEAVNAAPAGSTLTIAAGTYTEQVVITKNLTLIGAGEDTIIKAPAGVIDAIDAGAGSRASIVTVTNGATVTIQDLVVDGQGRGDELEVGATDFHGIAFINAGGTVDNVTVIGIRMPLDVNGNVSGIQQGRAIYANNADSAPRSLAVTNSTVEDFQKNAIDLRGAGLDVNVSGNTITGNGATPTTAQNGIVLGVSGEVTGSITGNIISEIGYTGPANSVSSGILSYGSDVTIANNTLTAPTPDVGETLKAAGIYVLNDDSGSDVQGNSISGFSAGVVSDGDGGQPILDNNTFSGNAANLQVVNPQVAVNLVGTDDADSLSGGAFDDTITGNGGDDTIDGNGGVDTVVYSDILNKGDFSYSGGTWTVTTASQGTDTLTGIEIVDHDGANNILLVGGGGFDTIQAAVNAAASGDTILIAPGAYAEAVTIPDGKTGLTILGANHGLAYDDAGRGAESILEGGFIVFGDGATIDGFEITEGTLIFGEIAGVYVQAANVTITNSILERSGLVDGDGSRGVINAVGNGDGLTVTNNQMSGWATGVYVQGADNVTVSGNALTGNYVGMSADAYPGDNDNLQVTNNTFDNELEDLGIGAVGGTSNGSIEGNSFTKGIFDYDPADNDGLIGANTIDKPVVVTVPGTSTQMGFDTIQEAIDAAPAGAVVTIAAGVYAENLVITQGITLVGVGNVTIEPADGEPITISGDLGGDDVTLQNLDIVGNTGDYGVYVTDNANVGTLTITGSSISGAGSYALFVYNADTNPTPSAAEVVVIDTTFANNGYDGATGAAHIKLFGFTGDATIQNVTIEGGSGGFAPSNLPNLPEYGIEITGVPNILLGAATPPMGQVSIDNVTITGQFEKNTVAIWNFGNIDGLSIDGLDLSDTETNWGPVFNIDGVTADYDASAFDIALPSGAIATELQGDKNVQDDTDQTITGTSGNDRIIGKTGNDTLIGGDGDDELFGHDKSGGAAAGDTGNDILIGGKGNDYLDGGAGIDTAVYSGNWSDYIITDHGGYFTIEDKRPGEDGIDTVYNVENFEFANATYSAANLLNVAPTDIDLLGGSVVENATNGTVVATLSTVDVNGGDTATYALLDNAGGRFAISGNQIVVANSGLLDFETATSHSVTVQVTDSGGLTYEETFVISVTDANDVAPNFTSPASFTIAENTTAVGTVVADDPDTVGDPIAYSITGGADQALFTIDSNTGALSFITAPDFEVASQYHVEVTASDGLNTSVQAITVNVTDVNDNAPVLQTTVFSVPENQTLIGNLVAIDPDLTGGPINYFISGGADASLFAINNLTGAISFLAAQDFEGASQQFEVEITVSDGTNSSTETVTINLTDVNDNAPVLTSSATFSIAENTTAVGTVTADDLDTVGGPITYAISGGADAALFTIDSNTGALSFVNAPDFETGPNSYSVQVTASDGVNLSVPQTITVTVTDVNDTAPNFISPASFTIAENTTAVGTVVATDLDTVGGPIAYAITGGADQALFTIDSNTGALAFIAAPDFETASQYHVEVTASDGLNTSVQAITVNVTDVNDNAPVITSPATFTVAENSTAVGIVTSSDIDTVGTPSYAITGGADAALFTINSETGALSFVNAPDFETDPLQYEVEVTVSDGVQSSAQTITVNLTDVNDNAPVITSSATFSIAENTTAVGTVTADDLDTVGGPITYAISGGADAALFTINAATGALSFVNAPDFETGPNSYSVQVTASDGVNTSVPQTITVTVTDVNDTAPNFISPASFTIAENTTAVGTVVATDLDTVGGPITYAITGGADQALFTINPTTGALAFIAAPDFETASQYNVEVTASDGLNTSVQSITVNVTDVNDTAPVIVTTSLSVAEGSTIVGAVVANDADTVGGPITYAITGGANQALFTINAATGLLSLVAPQDYEAGTTSFEVEVTASDGVNPSAPQTITVNLLDVGPGTPVDINAAANQVFEGAAAGTTVGIDIDASDAWPVLPDNAIYSIISDTSNGGFQINPTTGLVTVADGTKLDYETATQHTIIVQALDRLGGNAATAAFVINLLDVTGNTITGTSRADLINAVSGPSTNPTNTTTSEADIITPGKGIDTIDAGAGDDIIQINGKDNAADTLLGNLGTDTIRVLGTKAVTLNGFDTVFSSIERWEGNGAGIIGSKGNDVFDFSNLEFVSNMGTIDGGNGNDVITGTQFNDVIRGGKGIDTLNGGDGDDTFLLKGKDDAADIINGGAGFDTVQVTGSVTLNGFHAGNSSIEQWVGTGKGIKGSAGNDVFNFSALTSVVNMGIVDAGAGDDTVIGSSFADTLRGGVGNDRLDGGAGNDILTGGAGNDTFVYATGYGHDTVTDYAAGQDVFDLTGTGVADFASLQMADTAQGVVITFGIDDTLTINKATVALLTANQGDFLFA